MKTSDTHPRTLRVGMISLGCAKNLVDSEIMIGTLLKEGIEMTHDPIQADVLIVNTCSFIEAAQQESVDTILESSALREAQNRGQGLIVAGCLPQRFRDELPKLLPEVDAFMGIDQVAQVPRIVREAMARRAEKLLQSASKADVSQSRARTGKARRARRSRADQPSEEPAKTNLIGQPSESKRSPAPVNGKTPSIAEAPLVNVNPRPQYVPDYGTARFRLTPRHFAYVKIAEGCNHPCSFCIIPRMRGSHRSRAQADVVQEARQLLAEGVKELNLISQDSTYYGLDLRPNRMGSIAAPEKFKAAAKSLPVSTPTLCTLLRDLNEISGDFWIRLLYTHPAHWTDELIRTIAECPKVARYVDMPLQHIHGNMLERMRRETSRDYIVDLIERIRTGIPGIALRTTFIVGFPGETAACFESLLEFIRTTKFERLGVFTYSHEEGTRATGMMGQVPESIKRKRRALAMAEQLTVAREVSASYVGQDIRVLTEREANARDLKTTNLSSWEHGMLRGATRQKSRLAGSCVVARGEADAPDIDGRVYVRGQLPLGTFARVKVVGHTDYDLVAEPIGP